MDWAKLIKRIRSELLLTQVELSKMVGSSFASINRWENGRHEPTMAAKRKLKEICLQNGINMKEEDK